jgi:hypothetical protein
MSNPHLGPDGEEVTDFDYEAGSAVGPGFSATVPVRIGLSEIAAVRLSTVVAYGLGQQGMVARQGAPLDWSQPDAGGRYPADSAVLVGGGSLLIGEILGAEMVLVPGPVAPYLHGGLGAGMLATWPRNFGEVPLSDAYQGPTNLQNPFLACSYRANCASGEVSTLDPTGLVAIGAGVAAAEGMLRIEATYTRGTAPSRSLKGAGGEGIDEQRPYALAGPYQLLQVSAGLAFGG